MINDKTVYVTFVYHGNMCWDRYTKDQIREGFTALYRSIVDVWKQNPELRSNVELSGVTLKTLQQVAPDLLDNMKKLEEAGRLAFVGTHYAAQVNLCTDEETDIRSIWLGTEITRRELGATVQGFFPQELSYYPQLPRVLTENGLNWIVITPPRFVSRPIRLRGLEGTEVVGIPRSPFSLRQLWSNLESTTDEFEQLYDKFSDGDLIVFANDFEANWPAMLKSILKAAKDLKAKGKNVEFVTIPEYLEKHLIAEVEEMPVCRDIGPEDNVNSPSWSRWVSDPLDIIVHEQTKKAMCAVRHAETLASLLKEAYNIDVDLPIEESKTTLIDEPSGWCIEGVEDFPDVETEYLSRDGKMRMLSRMWHLLLIGVNSDSRGWYPIIERRRHRLNSLKNAELLSKEMIQNALGALSERIDLSKIKADRFFIVYNPLRSRKAHITLEPGIPYELLNAEGQPIPTLNKLTDEGILTEAIVDMPDYGYTVLGGIRGGSLKRLEWKKGTRIENAHISLSYEDGELKLRKSGKEVEIFLEPFKYKRLEIDKEPRTISCKAENTTTKVREGLNPEMLVYCQLEKGIDFIVHFILEEDILRCEAEFDFTQPAYVGEGKWMPNGLVISLKGKTGDVYYDIPYGVVKHHYKKQCFITASRFATVQSEKFGVALISTSGSQSFKCNAEEGVLGIGLGASTIGVPIDPKMGFTEDGQSFHSLISMEEKFDGKYRHSFSVYLFDGNWRDANIPQKARQQNEPVYVVEVPRLSKGDEPPVKSFISLQPGNVEITAVRASKQGLEIGVIETHNKDTDVELKIMGKTLRADMVANGFLTLKTRF